MKVKKVYKYGTGQEVPKGAVYLCTKVQTEFEGKEIWTKCWLVWHYFLVEVDTKEVKNVNFKESI